jgi:hypothetical protein
VWASGGPMTEVTELTNWQTPTASGIPEERMRFIAERKVAVGKCVTLE